MMYTECPICFNQPKEILRNINSGSIFCNGKFSHKHRTIYVNCEYAQPSELIDKLNTAWNDKCAEFNKIEWGENI